MPIGLGFISVAHLHPERVVLFSLGELLAVAVSPGVWRVPFVQDAAAQGVSPVGKLGGGRDRASRPRAVG